MLKCPQCGNENNLWKNGTHNGKQSYECQNCGKQFIDPQHRKNAAPGSRPKKERVKGTSGRPFIGENPLSPCCGVISVRKGKSHSKKHGTRDRYQCTNHKCAKTFTWPPVVKLSLAAPNPKEIRGEGNPHSRLSEKDVLEIIHRKASGENGREISEAIGASYSTVQGVLQGRTWGWLTGVTPTKSHSKALEA